MASPNSAAESMEARDGFMDEEYKYENIYATQALRMKIRKKQIWLPCNDARQGHPSKMVDQLDVLCSNGAIFGVAF